MEITLTPVERGVLREITRTQGKPFWFLGAEMHAAKRLVGHGLVELKERTGYMLTNLGKEYAREAGWLPPVPSLEAQHERTLLSAEKLLVEVQRVVECLRAGDVPTKSAIPSTLALATEHTKLVSLHETLGVVDTNERDEAAAPKPLGLGRFLSWWR